MRIRIRKSQNCHGRVKISANVIRRDGAPHHTVVRLRTKGMKRWLCSCENFLFEKSGKRRHCEHLHEAKRAAMRKFRMKWVSL
jgi:hypothetical protein